MGIDFNEVLNLKIIDNRRKSGETTITLAGVLKYFLKNAKGLKAAVGYLYLGGLDKIMESMENLEEIKILMGYTTDKPTKDALLEAFQKDVDDIQDSDFKDLAAFYQLVFEEKLQIRVYFSKRLHSKMYLILRAVGEDVEVMEKYKCAIVGSSNLSPSGLLSNTELNVIIEERRDLRYLEEWFQELWEKGTENYEDLQVRGSIKQIVEKSRYREKIAENWYFTPPTRFFLLLIKYLDADFLFDTMPAIKLFQFQVIDFQRVLFVFNVNLQRGCFITSSVGLGKSYVACQVAKYFLDREKRVLILVPAGLKRNVDQWPRYLREFGIASTVQLESMGMLQVPPQDFNVQPYSQDFGLIIIDEAHNFRRHESYRTRNLKSVIDANGNAKVLLLTATPINTRLEDLINLIRLFHRENSDLTIDRLIEEFESYIELFKEREYEDLGEDDRNALVELQEELERTFFVKSTRETLRTSRDYVEELTRFTGIDIEQIPDPDVEEIEYPLHQDHMEILEGLPIFIREFKAAHLLLINPEKGANLQGIFKWILFKRFESDIYSYYITLRRLLQKEQRIQRALREQNINLLESQADEADEEYGDIDFNIDFRESLEWVIEDLACGKRRLDENVFHDLQEDIILLEEQVHLLAPLIAESGVFRQDAKIETLLDLIRKHTEGGRKLLIFSEYRDTVYAINRFMDQNFENTSFQCVDASTQEKSAVIEKFNQPGGPLRVLITTDTLSEGYNLGGADVVINFDIPYNPVKLIQRIGRATRIDNPKHIQVYNFRPNENFDYELKIVDTLQLRIKDIIRFVGIEYRIWFAIEHALLEERQQRDRDLYARVLQEVQRRYRQGQIGQSSEVYERPIIHLLRQSIHTFNLKKEDLSRVKTPLPKMCTSIRGEKNLAIVNSEKTIFHEQTLFINELHAGSKILDFQTYFKDELGEFASTTQQVNISKKLEQFRNNDIKKMAKEVLLRIRNMRLEELRVNTRDLGNILRAIDQGTRIIGSNTVKVLKDINNLLKTTNARDITSDNITVLIHRIETSLQKTRQTRIIFNDESKVVSLMAIAITPEETEGTMNDRA
ncbi:MAG: helicase domain-containing protein [Promethearchaeota archaeon CR_4]|nr:MAG: helicase domain-containing protein [Candidatus Lokiarchaeota archaeon CR_4]